VARRARGTRAAYAIGSRRAENSPASAGSHRDAAADRAAWRSPGGARLARAGLTWVAVPSRPCRRRDTKRPLPAASPRRTNGETPPRAADAEPPAAGEDPRSKPREARRTGGLSP
jgi:hypothetical protein